MNSSNSVSLGGNLDSNWAGGMSDLKEGSLELASVQIPMLCQLADPKIDSLLILARGLGMHRLIVNFLRTYCDAKALVLVINATDAEQHAYPGAECATTHFVASFTPRPLWLPCIPARSYFYHRRAHCRSRARLSTSSTHVYALKSDHPLPSYSTMLKHFLLTLTHSW